MIGYCAQLCKSDLCNLVPKGLNLLRVPYRRHTKFWNQQSNCTAIKIYSRRLSFSTILLMISNAYVNGPMAQNVSSPLDTLPTFLKSSLSEAEKAEATTAMHYILGHAHHIAMENGCTFQGDVHRIQGSEILVLFKVDFSPTEEFPETEHYSKMVCLNLRGDYHSQLIYHVIDAIIYVTPVVPGRRYIKHTCCIFTSNVWAHKYHLCHPELPNHQDRYWANVLH